MDPSTVRSKFVYEKMYDTRRVLHVWRILKMIIECDFKLFMQHVMQKPVSKDILALYDANQLSTDSDESTEAVNNYLDLLVVTALRYLNLIRSQHQ